jgi:predicted kinase
MNKIIILRGNIASGKSTAGLALQKKLGRGTLLIQQDTVRREMLWVKEEPNTMSVSLLKTLAEYGNKNCDYTILEGLLYSDINESLFRYITELYGKQIYAYYFDIPFEEALIRQKQRPIHNKFGEDEMRKWWREKDLLNFIPEKIVNTISMAPDEIVKMIIEDNTDNKPC